MPDSDARAGGSGPALNRRPEAPASAAAQRLMGSASVLRDPANAVARALANARDPVRLKVVRRTGLLDAGLRESLQRYTRLAAELTQSSLSVVTVLDADRQYLSGAFGTDLVQTPLDSSYCKHPVADGRQLCVEDSWRDAVLAANRATFGMGVRAYLGSPFSAAGSPIGALCVIDQEPRRWTEDDRQVIAELAVAVAADVELRLGAAPEEEKALQVDPDRADIG
jgi:GAF domain-containing protein